MEKGYIASTSGIGAKDKIGYAMGDLASCLVFGLTQSVMNKYYTDGLGIAVSSVMIMTIIARIWDAINDPIWGRLIDGAKPKADGRYRRWIKIFALPVALSAVLMFVGNPAWADSTKLAYIYVTYILFGMLYTCINIPYGSLAQVITSNDKERSSLSVFRSIGSVFGALPAMVLAGVMYTKISETESVVDSQEGPHRRRRHRGAVGAGLPALLQLDQGAGGIPARSPGEGPDHEGHQGPLEEPPLHGGVPGLHALPGRPDVRPGLQHLPLPQLLQQARPDHAAHRVPVSARGGGHVLRRPPGQQAGPTGGLRLGRAAGRRVHLVLFVLALFGITSIWLYLAACLASGVGTAFIFLLIWALATDAIDYNKVKFGLNDEATSYAFYSFMRKLGQTVATILINVPLLRIGYDGSKLNTEGLTPEALQSMYNSSVMIPAVLFLLVFLLLRFVYPLSKQKIDELQVEKEQVLGGKKA